MLWSLHELSSPIYDQMAYYSFHSNFITVIILTFCAAEYIEFPGATTAQLSILQRLCLWQCNTWTFIIHCWGCNSKMLQYLQFPGRIFTVFKNSSFSVPTWCKSLRLEKYKLLSFKCQTVTWHNRFWKLILICTDFTKQKRGRHSLSYKYEMRQILNTNSDNSTIFRESICARVGPDKMLIVPPGVLGGDPGPTRAHYNCFIHHFSTSPQGGAGFHRNRKQRHARQTLVGPTRLISVHLYSILLVVQLYKFTR